MGLLFHLQDFYVILELLDVNLGYRVIDFRVFIAPDSPQLPLANGDALDLPLFTIFHRLVFFADPLAVRSKLLSAFSFNFISGKRSRAKNPCFTAWLRL